MILKTGATGIIAVFTGIMLYKVTPASQPIELAKVEFDSHASNEIVIDCEETNHHDATVIDTQQLQEDFIDLTPSDKGSLALLKFQLKLLQLPENELFLFLQEKRKLDADDAQTELLSKVAFLAAKQNPLKAFELFGQLNREQKEQMGLSILSGVAEFKPQLVWDWVEKHLPYDSSSNFMDEVPFMDLTGKTLYGLALKPESRWQAYELAKTVEPINKFRHQSWIRQYVARTIAKTAPQEAIAYAYESGKPDQNLLQGIAQGLSETSLSNASNFALEHQGALNLDTLKDIAFRLLLAGETERTHEFIHNLESAKLRSRIYSDSKFQLSRLEGDKIAAFLGGIKDPSERQEVAQSTVLFMGSHDHSLEDYFKIYDSVYDNVNDRNMDYGFAQVIARWHKRRPDLTAPFLQEIAEDGSKGSQSANTFAHNFLQASKDR